MNKSSGTGHGDDGKRQASSTTSVGAVKRPTGGTALHLYKAGQGAYVRWVTAAAVGIVVCGIANFLYEQLARVGSDLLWVQVFIPVIILLILGYVTFKFLGQNKSVVDFMIATEGEMKKVNWSTRREVLGATKVVIATVLALGATLFAANILFMFVFESIGVLKIGMLSRMFGGGE